MTKSLFFAAFRLHPEKHRTLERKKNTKKRGGRKTRTSNHFIINLSRIQNLSVTFDSTTNRAIEAHNATSVYIQVRFHYFMEEVLKAL